jgi:hypothetical protein
MPTFSWAADSSSCLGTVGQEILAHTEICTAGQHILAHAYSKYRFAACTDLQLMARYSWAADSSSCLDTAGQQILAHAQVQLGSRF